MEKTWPAFLTLGVFALACTLNVYSGGPSGNDPNRPKRRPPTTRCSRPLMRMETAHFRQQVQIMDLDVLLSTVAPFNAKNTHIGWEEIERRLGQNGLGERDIERAISHFAPFPDSQLDILLIGGGKRDTDRFLADFPKSTVTVVEHNRVSQERLIERYREALHPDGRPRVSVIRGSILETEFPSGHFDGVFGMNSVTVEFAPVELLALFHLIQKCLKPKGVFGIDVPDARGHLAEEGVVDQIAIWDLHTVDRRPFKFHGFLATHEQIRELARRAGLQPAWLDPWSLPNPGTTDGTHPEGDVPISLGRYSMGFRNP